MAHISVVQANKVRPQYVRHDDPCVIACTSGTTGKATTMMHSCISALLYSAASTMYTFGYMPDRSETVLCTSGFSWMYGFCNGLIGPLLLGAKVISIDLSMLDVSPQHVWDLILDSDNDCSVSVLVTTLPKLLDFCTYWQTVSEEKKTVGHLKKISYGGYLLDLHEDELEILRAFSLRNKHVNMINCYGQSELTNSILTSATVPYSVPPSPLDEHKRLLPMLGVKTDLQERDISDGSRTASQKGCEVVIKSPIPGFTQRFIGDRDEIDKKWKKTTRRDCYRTGDIGIRHDDGRIEIIGREADYLVISGPTSGSPIHLHASELEKVLKSSLTVHDAMAVNTCERGDVWVLLVPKNWEEFNQEEVNRLHWQVHDSEELAYLQIPMDTPLIQNVLKVPSLDVLRPRHTKPRYALLREFIKETEDLVSKFSAPDIEKTVAALSDLFAVGVHYEVKQS